MALLVYGYPVLPSSLQLWLSLQTLCSTNHHIPPTLYSFLAFPTSHLPVTIYIFSSFFWKTFLISPIRGSPGEVGMELLSPELWLIYRGPSY